ncbi:hypothetical protein MIND_00117300 [Mycena indigotica]|uniref:Uncharacterized protein n=1 Tax=Mycena indigotica TaxID=2126181 RepID=A0A8H6THU3_9AGAR|nr:uncharacterized protein MIND_00117300 [Mycena indigotica]KAF7316000.1 hypothetical protein MIND_00117300 [Mycena indigotica]
MRLYIRTRRECVDQYSSETPTSMAKLDIPNQLIGIASLWPTTLIYGVNIAMFVICWAILVKKHSRGQHSWFLLSAISVQFLLSTAHIICALGAAVNAFTVVSSTAPTAQLTQVWISPLGRWTNARQLMHTLNNFIGDIILIWRLYVVYGNNWWIIILPVCLAGAEVACNLYSIITTFVNPSLIIKSLMGTRSNSFDQVVIAGFSLMAATQLVVTTLLAIKIYSASQSLRKLSRVATTGRNLSTYSDIIWMLVESGSVMAIVDLIWLACWKQGLGGISECILAILGQLSPLVSFSIIARIGLHLAFNGDTSASGSKSQGSSTSATLEFRARSGTTTRSALTASGSATELKPVWKEETQGEIV